jgi:hypothetical protein
MIADFHLLSAIGYLLVAERVLGEFSHDGQVR